MKTSPSSDSCLATSSLRLDSREFGTSKKRVFSKRSISPLVRLKAKALVSGDRMSDANLMGLFKRR